MGGTDFIGSHAVAAIKAAGHDVELWVRSLEKIKTALQPDGIDGDVDHAVDPVSVRGAVDGCDAVVHAAAIYDIDSRVASAIQSSRLAVGTLVCKFSCAS